jgi:hypothetical protein
MTREPAHHRKARLRDASKPLSCIAFSACPPLSLLAWSEPTTPAHATQLKMLTLSAWQRIKEGYGTLDDWDWLVETCNVMGILAEPIGAEVVAVCQAAQDALCTMGERYKRLGRMGACAQSLAAIPQLLELYAQMVVLYTPKQLANAAREADRLMRSGQGKQVL